MNSSSPPRSSISTIMSNISSHPTDACPLLYSKEEPLLLALRFGASSSVHRSPAPGLWGQGRLGRSRRRIIWHLHEVGHHDLPLAQFADAALHGPQDLLQTPVQRQQVRLGQNRPERVAIQGLAHHLAQAEVWPGQQMQAEQR
ncbi:hypothetical protein AALO_G00281070 [Alosa alosa]|uniref:Uncharacterized protein n=1 Tax=Alosa alosa TaxID=278164 RepID=A0AAV6FKA7_9TELE|nr:hypothetical protein AALO_G00281070 [Alosa alosa]